MLETGEKSIFSTKNIDYDVHGRCVSSATADARGHKELGAYFDKSKNLYSFLTDTFFIRSVTNRVNLLQYCAARRSIA